MTGSISFIHVFQVSMESTVPTRFAGKPIVGLGGEEILSAEEEQMLDEFADEFYECT